MKNFEINELNEKAKNELKKEDQNGLMKRNSNDIKNIIVFSGTIIVVVYAFYAFLVNDVQLAEIFYRLFGFDRIK
jgi:hypothetical protein